jgi:hypothetical protein
MRYVYSWAVLNLRQRVAQAVGEAICREPSILSIDQDQHLFLTLSHRLSPYLCLPHLVVDIGIQMMTPGDGSHTFISLEQDSVQNDRTTYLALYLNRP